MDIISRQVLLHNFRPSFFGILLFMFVKFFLLLTVHGKKEYTI